MIQISILLCILLKVALSTLTLTHPSYYEKTSDGRQCHKYQQNEQLSLTSRSAIFCFSLYLSIFFYYVWCIMRFYCPTEETPTHDKGYQLLGHVRLRSADTPVFATSKTNRHDISEYFVESGSVKHSYTHSFDLLSVA